MCEAFVKYKNIQSTDSQLNRIFVYLFIVVYLSHPNSVLAFFQQRNDPAFQIRHEHTAIDRSTQDNSIFHLYDNFIMFLSDPYLMQPDR
jgi:hypothetical protein